MMLSKHSVMPAEPPAGEYRFETTSLWLRLSDLLEEVYRIYVPPGEQEEWTGVFPSFEEVCEGISINIMQPSHRGVYMTTLADVQAND